MTLLVHLLIILVLEFVIISCFFAFPMYSETYDEEFYVSVCNQSVRSSALVVSRVVMTWKYYIFRG